MAKSKSRPQNHAGLRKQAEEFLNQNPEAVKKTPPRDILNLVEELQIHQIELEMQNEELRRTQLELEAARDKYSDLYDFAPVGYFTINAKGTILEANLTGAAMLGVERSFLIGKPFTHFIARDTQNGFHLHRNSLFETKGRQTCEVKIAAKDGAQIHVQLKSRSVQDDDGDIIRIRTAVTDINTRKLAEEALKTAHDQLEQRVQERTFELAQTNERLKHEIAERKRSAEALRESEEKYREFFENESDAVMVFDSESLKFEDANRAVLDLYGYTKDEFLALGVEDISAETEKTRMAVKKIKAGDPGSERVPLRYFKKKDGTVFPGEVCSGVFTSKGRKKIIGAVRDITDRMRLENELRQVHKMEAIGTLTGGIAHEFNNIVGIIMGNAELALDDIPESDLIYSNLKEILSAGLRAKDVVRQLLSFSRKVNVQRKQVKMIPVIQDALKFLRVTIPTNIEICPKIQAEADTVLADSTQIHQIMINLGTNALHAMEETGGILGIGIQNVVLDKDTASIDLGLIPGNYVKVTVSDTGQGIDPGVINQIFDPYFTTKDIGKGSGMGLSVVLGIIKTHEGAISVESELGKGTVFSVYLPVVEEKAIIESKIVAELPTGNESILFIDDEEAIVKMGLLRLERLGYKVLAATSPVAALELFRSKPDQFDLIITDMAMPKMAGDMLAMEMLKIRPDMPIILCTGFSEKISKETARSMGISGYIEKPIDKHDFAKMVRKVLDANQK